MTSFASANGPSVTVRCPPPTRAGCRRRAGQSPAVGEPSLNGDLRLKAATPVRSSGGGPPNGPSGSDSM